MAGEAAREFIMECLFVRLAMTVGTLRHIAVFVLVAGYAGQRPVLADVLRQFVEYLGMAGSTCAGGNILGEGDLQRPMDRMARQTGCQCLPFGMRFVTGEAGRLEAVRCVARHTGNLRVLARVCDQLLTDGTVAVEAGVYKLGRRGDLPWRVRIVMTGTAFSDLRSVWCFMAGVTLGHDRIPIPLARVIGVKKVMAVPAGETVPASVILEVLERTGVALGALGRRERLCFGGILLRSRRNRNRCDLFPLRRCQRHPRENQCDHHS